MKRVKLIWLAVIAAFALTAVAVTAGSAVAAEPEWGHCVSAKKGFYSDSNCTTKDEKKGKPKGKFEWVPGAAAVCFAQKHGKYKDAGCTELDEKKGQPKGKYEKTGGPKFTGAGGAGILTGSPYACQKSNEGSGGEFPRTPHEGCKGESDGFVGLGIGASVECESEQASGEASGADEVVNVSVRFKGCTYFGNPATSEGSPAGEIQTATLKGKLGYLNGAKHEVGVLLEPAVAKGLFAEFYVNEGGNRFKVGEGNATEGAFYEKTPGVPTGNDGVISPIAPVNQMTHTFTQNYRVERVEAYEPASCPVSHTCPLGTEGEFGKPNLDYLNVPSHFEGGPTDALEFVTESVTEPEGSSWSPAGEEITNVNTVEGEAEIKG